ncbi:MsnO8 family LLM class oxidoreductase [Arthrobacter sp. JSM 101049]|uniref:MsnO8 family LLM class oxidoreductase n=1 Tax=Arthrobacter sp. JSM 101049 TaxID=929097 RepID=UPI00356354F0
MTRLPPLSILDRAMVRSGEPEGRAPQAVIERAQRIDGEGIKRFWVAEHHGVPGIAGSAPAVLMGAIAAATTRLRVGSGGIMLPNHQPLVVAEQAATLDRLHPGRIDLGLGRSLGFTPAVRSGLRVERYGDRAFSDDLAELVSYLDGEAPFTSRPRPFPQLPVFILATRRAVAIAARAGLGVVLGGPVAADPRQAGAVVAGYREAFRPSGRFARPHVTVAVTAMAAATDERARELLLPEAWAMAQSRTRGEFRPLEPAHAIRALAMTARQRALVEDHLDAAVHGSPARVQRRLADLAAATGADEILLTGSTFDVEDQACSDRLLGRMDQRRDDAAPPRP